jgi:hypothetical protein
MKARKILIAGIVLCAGMIGACSSGSDNPTGTVSFSLMDRPVDGVTSLYVTISEMWLKPADGPAFKLDMTSTPLTVNLLELNDENASVLVDQALVPAVRYNWVEMKIEDADIGDSYAMTTSGGMVPVDVDVPSNRIRLVSGFEVDENQGVRIVFDWDVRKGLTEAVGQQVLLLRPAFRILYADEYGSISGTISTDTIQANCDDVMDPAGKVVYVFEGNVTPDDIDGTSPEPTTTADPVFNTDTGDWDYRLVVMPGDYTVACKGDTDLDPPSSEDLSFVNPVAPYDNGFVNGVTAETPVEDVNF